MTQPANSSVFINKTKADFSGTALEVSGNVAFSKISYLSNITEKVATTTTISGSLTSVTCTLDYNNGSTFYIPTYPGISGGPTSALTYNVTNFPNLYDCSRSYVITTLIRPWANSNASIANLYAGSISYSTTSTASSTYFPIRFSTAPSSILPGSGTYVTSTTNNTLISQTIAYIYQPDCSYVISNLSYYNV